MGFPFSSVTANCFFAVKKHPCGIWHIVFGHSVFFCGSHKYRVIFFTSLFIISPPSFNFSRAFRFSAGSWLSVFRCLSSTVVLVYYFALHLSIAFTTFCCVAQITGCIFMHSYKFQVAFILLPLTFTTFRCIMKYNERW